MELGAESEMNLLDDVRSAVLEKARMGTPGLYREARRAAEDLLSPYLVDFHRRLAYGSNFMERGEGGIVFERRRQQVTCI